MARGALGQTAIGKAYLFVYNLVMCIGWTYGLVTFYSHVMSSGQLVANSWNTVALSITIFQTIQSIEVLHCILGLVPSDPVQTAMQILSRLVVVWGILRPVEESRSSIGVPLLITAWSIAELTRYIYYALNIYNIVPYILTWARYTFFIALYPMGVSGELLTIIAALPTIQAKSLYAIKLPNALNISFYYEYALIAIMLSYIPFFPQLYFYMLRQRSKFLGPQVAKKAK